MNKKVYMFSEGNKDQKKLLGGKGANLCEMTNIGLPVPKGFIVTTEACNEFLENNNTISKELLEEVEKSLKNLEELTGKQFGGANPLLVSIRSGAPISMPGMMDTVLNLGLNDKTVQYIYEKSKNLRFAYEIYSRFIEMFSDIVTGIPREKFVAVHEEMKNTKTFASEGDFYQALTDEFKKIYKIYNGEDFPQDPKIQLNMAIAAIFNSWNNERAKVYRELNDIDEKMGTAVNVQEMVFGNLNDKSATGVAFSRNPATGENKVFGEYLIQAQGEDIVAGIRTPEPLDDMAITMPKIHDEFINYAKKLENYYRDMQDIEFTIEDGKLYILQTRNGKRSPHSAVKAAVDMVSEGLITKEEAILRINPKDVAILLLGSFNKKSLDKAHYLGNGLAGSAGIAVGKIILRSEDVKDSDSILVRNETSPEDLRGMSIASGILTAKGGLTSHGAVVARSMGKCCVAGCSDLFIDLDKNEVKIGDVILKQGDYISIDGYSGKVYLGKLEIDPADASSNFYTLLEWANEIKRLKVRMNADTPEDCQVGLKFGAQGIGLCRTEHMFFKGERIWAMREMILANSIDERLKALNKLLPYQKQDFIEIFKLMKDKSVNIRLLDPPLHEFLPNTLSDLDTMSRIMHTNVAAIKERVKKLEEHNPMLGHRGCRLAVTYPEIYITQAEAIMEAIIEVKKEGIDPHVEIMIPLVVELKELNFIVNKIEEAMKSKFGDILDEINYCFGTMIELPRACTTADKIAETAAFFSFGTNDLTQTAYGMSRDDSGKFIEEYKEDRIFEKSPFEILDREGVGALMRIAVKLGRATKPDLKIGICGEHGGEPSSIEFCNEIGLNYVSCSPYRVPVAILAAAQSTIKREQHKK